MGAVCFTKSHSSIFEHFLLRIAVVVATSFPNLTPTINPTCAVAGVVSSEVGGRPFMRGFYSRKDSGYRDEAFMRKYYRVQAEEEERRSER